jgi:hypothetical protein
MTLRAPVEGIHAVATGWVGLVTKLGQGGPPQVNVGVWPSVAATGEVHAATGAATGVLMDRVASNASKVTRAAAGYQNTDLAGAHAVEAVRPA